MKIGIIGNPNVGKSLIFSSLSGVGVEVTNYPGTTVGLQSGTVCCQKNQIELLDLPGIYSLDGLSDEESLVRDVIQHKEIDALLVITDAAHLERNLYLLLQIAEYDIPLVIVLNMVDEAKKQGLIIDTGRLSHLIGSPVIETIATEGKNIDKILPLTISEATPATIPVFYDRHIEAGIRSLNKMFGISKTEALLALQGIERREEITEASDTISTEIENEHRMSVSQIIAANRHHAAKNLASEVCQKTKRMEHSGIDRFLTKTIPGIPILLCVIIGMLLCVFIIGTWMEEQIVLLFDNLLINPLLALHLDPLVSEIAFSVLIALQAGLGIAFPFILTFYLLISYIEDTGYMTRAAFLADRTMHHFGLHGQAIIPMVLGFGCNVPAIMGIRNLTSKRERIIASFLITMVPCSARTVIIAGIVAAFVGIAYAFSIYLIIFFLLILTGFIFSRVIPGQQLGMVLEMPPLRKPSLYQVIIRSWIHIREFLFIAMPLLIVSSIILGIFEYFGILSVIEGVFAPMMESLLGLPDFVLTALLFGILRKEMAFETLVVLAGTADLLTVMTKVQLYIFAIVSTLFVPCISTIAVLGHEIGWRYAFLISGYTILLGLATGAVIHGINLMIP
ncbi:MAG: ferrous iron transport protein B [Methanospirillaceae archaeon]|nr:ferrous iron transport protein B [Methanospirillaceae archaeon]